MSDKLKQYQFQPKQSGNPGGRPKGFERRLREIVEGEMVEHPTDQTAGRIPAWDAIVLKAIDDALHASSPAARKHGRDFIADRLMGKPKQDIRIEDVTPVETEKVAELSDEQLEILAAIGMADAQKLH